MEIDVFEPILTHKNIKWYVGQQYPYSTIWEKKIMAIPHIYWARAFFLLIFDNQDTESDYQGMEIGLVGAIFIYKNTKGYVG